MSTKSSLLCPVRFGHPLEGFLLLLFGKGRRCGQDTGVRLEAVWMIVQHERSELNLRFRPQ
jgi:hypothetical protein